MDHYLTRIDIENLRHLKKIQIDLNPDSRQHLLLTGKNGSGKTTVLNAISRYLSAINDGKLYKLKNEYLRYLDNYVEALSSAQTESEKFEKQRSIEIWMSEVNKYQDGLELHFNQYDDLDTAFKRGEYILAFFPADRKTDIEKSDGVEEVKLKEYYRLNDDPSAILLKYMVHLKTQQAYARNEYDDKTITLIQDWFNRFEDALKQLLTDETIKLEYNYKEYNFQIIEDGKEPFGFDQLADGYSSVINIVSDLILRMDKNWILKNDLSEYNYEGIVLIDELETHLHIELQKKILPFLTEFFPRIQFIVTTHSPYILNSIDNAKAYDLEKHIELENMLAYSSEDLAEAYFDSDEFSEQMKGRLQKYRELVLKDPLTEDERALRADLRYELGLLSKEMSEELKAAFEDIERQRKKDG